MLPPSHYQRDHLTPLLPSQAQPFIYSTISIVIASPVPTYHPYHLNVSITTVQCNPVFFHNYNLVLFFLCSQFLYPFFLFFYVDAAPELVEKSGDNSLSKLKHLYTVAKDLSETEVKYAHSIFYNSDKFHFYFIFPFNFIKLVILVRSMFCTLNNSQYLLGCSVSNLLLSQLDALLPSGPPGQPRRRIGLC